MRPGDRVTLLGRDGDEAIDANELGAWAGTIGYEVVARLPAAVPRRYVEAEGAHAACGRAQQTIVTPEP